MSLQLTLRAIPYLSLFRPTGMWGVQSGAGSAASLGALYGASGAPPVPSQPTKLYGKINQNIKEEPSPPANAGAQSLWRAATVGAGISKRQNRRVCRMTNRLIGYELTKKLDSQPHIRNPHSHEHLRCYLRFAPDQPACQAGSAAALRAHIILSFPPCS